MKPNGLKWAGGIVVGAAIVGLAVYLATLGWEKAGWVAGVVSMFLTVAGVGLAVAGEIRGRREAGPGGQGPAQGLAQGSVTNTISGTTNSGTIIQGRTVNPPPGTAPAAEPPVREDGPADGAAGQG
ncbi:hypothetical protein [Actinocorallia libanotica]